MNMDTENIAAVPYRPGQGGGGGLGGIRKGQKTPGRSFGNAVHGMQTPAAQKRGGIVKGGSTRRALGDITNRRGEGGHTSSKVGPSISKTPFKIAGDYDENEVEIVARAPKSSHVDTPAFDLDEIDSIMQNFSFEARDKSPSLSPVASPRLPHYSSSTSLTASRSFEVDENILDIPFPETQPIQFNFP